MMVLFHSTLAMAQAPTRGRVFMRVSGPDTRIVEFPRGEADRVEIGLYENYERLDEQLANRTAQYLLHADARTVGGGTWFVSLWLKSPDIQVELVHEGEEFWVFLQPGEGPAPPEAGLPGELAALIGGEVVRDIAPEPAMSLKPLYGEASTLQLRPQDYRLRVPAWDMPSVSPPYGELLETPPGTMQAIEGYRRVLTEARGRRTRAMALFMLGLGHMEVGLPRDAHYYMKRLSHLPGGWPPDTVHLSIAQTALSSGKYEEARDHCVLAARTAEPELVLECLGIVSLATANPPPTQTALALLGATQDPVARFLGAQLLQMDNRHMEAARVYEQVVVDMEDSDQRLLALAAYGDALYLTGRSEDAHSAYTSAMRHRGIYDILILRQEMLRMHKEGWAEWPGHVPDLERLTRRSDEVGAEAIYLLAQIATHYGDPHAAGEYLDQMFDKHERFAERSDAGERLVRACSLRMSQFEKLKLWDDQVAFYRDCWRDSLNEQLTDTRALESISAAYIRLGLYEQALAVQIEVTQIHSSTLARDDLDALLRLSWLYTRTGRHDEALRTLQYTAKSGEARAELGRLLIHTGEALYRSGRVEEAMVPLRVAASRPESAEQGRRVLAILQAESGLCREALPTLQDLWENPPVDIPLTGPHPEDLNMAYARCLLAVDQFERASEVATATAASAKRDRLRDQAAYLASVATQRLSLGAFPEGVISPPAYEKLVGEEARHGEFEALLDEHNRRR